MSISAAKICASAAGMGVNFVRAFVPCSGTRSSRGLVVLLKKTLDIEIVQLSSISVIPIDKSMNNRTILQAVEASYPLSLSPALCVDCACL